jgi:NADH-quinone oxidoreductase subunit F
MNDKDKQMQRGFTKNQDNLLSMLSAAQQEMNFLSPEAVGDIGRQLKLTDNEVAGFASIYPIFRFELAPGNPADADRAEVQERPKATDHDELRPPRNIDEYLAGGGFKGISRALRFMPADLEAAVGRSGLREIDGGDRFLVQRWRQCRQSDGDRKYLLVHAAALEPFGLEVPYLMEGNLFPVLEGMLIAAFTAGASHGIVCIDSRRSEILPVLEAACRQMRAGGYLGGGILGSAFNFDVAVKVVQGPIRWGDGRRLIGALEGRRIMECSDRIAFHGRPTIMHTPEILQKLPAIVNHGPDWYAGLGVTGHPGTQTITLMGKVRQPGRYEIPMGSPLNEIVESFGGGVPQGETLKAVQIGGPTGAWLPIDALDIPLDPQALAAAGAALGPGIINLATQDTCALDLARQALVYAKDQSCGHCLFCREGTRQMADILTEIATGRSETEDLDLLAELAQGMRLNAACHLGRTAPDAYLSTLRYFREEYDAHLKTRRCPAGVCTLGTGGREP